MDYDDMFELAEMYLGDIETEKRQTIPIHVKSLHTRAPDYFNTCCGKSMNVESEEYVCKVCGKTSPYNGGIGAPKKSNDVSSTKIKTGVSYAEQQYKTVKNKLREANANFDGPKFDDLTILKVADTYNKIQRNKKLDDGKGGAKKFIKRGEHQKQILSLLLQEEVTKAGSARHPSDVERMLGCNGRSKGQKILQECRDVTGNNDPSTGIQNSIEGFINYYTSVLDLPDDNGFIKQIVLKAQETNVSSSTQLVNQIIGATYIYCRSKGLPIDKTTIEQKISQAKFATFNKFCTAVKNNAPKFMSIFKEHNMVPKF